MTAKAEKEAEAKGSKIKVLVQQWAAAKECLAAAEKDVEGFKTELVALGIAGGYEDELLQVVGTEKIDLKNKKLSFTLWKHGVFLDAHESKLSEAKVKELAKANAAIARAVKQATEPGLRFNAKKKT